MRRMLKMVLVATALMATPVLAEDEAPAKTDTPSGETFRHSGSLLDRSPQHRSQMLSVFLGLPYGYFYYGGFPFGLGGRYLIPILHDGFIPAVNDSFSIEFGVDFSGVLGRTFYPVLSIPVEVMWQFHFTPKFSAYAKVGIALEFNFVSYLPGHRALPHPDHRRRHRQHRPHVQVHREDLVPRRSGLPVGEGRPRLRHVTRRAWR